MITSKIKFAYIILSVITLISCSKARITGVTASSSLFDKNGTYLPENLLDNNPATCWVEAGEGDGCGEEIILTLNKNTSIKSIAIRNGYGKPEFWQANNRVKEIEVASENSSFIATLKDLPDEQTITPPSDFKCTRILFRIKSVYKGSKFNDTALSEIKINNIEITPNLFTEENQKIELLKSEAVSFYRDFNKTQMKKYKDYDKCGETGKINDILNHPEKHVAIKKFSLNFAIVGSPTIYPQ